MGRPEQCGQCRCTLSRHMIRVAACCHWQCGGPATVGTGAPARRARRPRTRISCGHRPAASASDSDLMLGRAGARIRRAGAPADTQGPGHRDGHSGPGRALPRLEAAAGPDSETVTPAAAGGGQVYRRSSDGAGGAGAGTGAPAGPAPGPRAGQTAETLARVVTTAAVIRAAGPALRRHCLTRTDTEPPQADSEAQCRRGGSVAGAALAATAGHGARPCEPPRPSRRATRRANRMSFPRADGRGCPPSAIRACEPAAARPMAPDGDRAMGGGRSRAITPSSGHRLDRPMGSRIGSASPASLLPARPTAARAPVCRLAAYRVTDLESQCRRAASSLSVTAGRPDSA